MPTATSAEALARFRSGMKTLVSGPGPFGVAVSGGSDSLALLLLCDAAFPGKTFAATVDHGLRPESAREAAFVALVCQSMGVPHRVLHAAEPAGGNIQDWARRERYAALGDWAAERGLTAILTAHHADDQLETIIMRLNRGSGVAGLSGIRARQGKVLRPLLGWRRAELTRIVEAAALVPVDDPSNRDDRFDRARLRKALANADWLDPAAAGQSAAALADAETALEWAAAQLFEERTKRDDHGLTCDPGALPDELRRRLALRCLRNIAPDAAPRGDALTRLIATLDAGEVATLSGVRCAGGATWRFTPAPARQKN